MERDTKVNNKINLTIVIISFNTKVMTRECLNSIYENAGEGATQVIVVDNDSKDGTVEMIREYFPLVELIVNSDNRGFAAANNQGFEIAQGELILLLNSDTIILDDVVENSVGYMLANPEVGAMGCRVLNTDMTMQSTCSGYPTLLRLLFLTIGLDRLKHLKLFDSYLLRNWKRDYERDVDVISGCYLLTRREVIEQVGPLSEDFFFFGEETDWCLRMRKADWALRFSPVGEIVHHGGGSVKKLNYQRDVMLTNATILLHKKNGGLVSAFLAFLILTMFNLSRAVFWSISSLWSSENKLRAKHFRQVTLKTISMRLGK